MQPKDISVAIGKLDLDFSDERAERALVCISTQEPDKFAKQFFKSDCYGLSKYVFLMWFILATVALAASGIYAILPIFLRMPVFAEFGHFKNIFKVSLIIHVNLAVLVWFLSSMAMLMTSVTKKALAPISFTAFIVSMMGTVAMIVSPFIGPGEPVLNNYVPILHNFAFIIGIALFISGVILQTIITLLSFTEIKGDLIRFSSYMNGMIFMIAVICFIKAAIELKLLSNLRFIDLEEYYELLFWGAGHILQFNYVQLIIITWLVLIGHTVADRFKICFFALEWINFAFISLAIAAYFLYPIDSIELYEFFTLQMRYLGGVLIAIIAIWTARNLSLEQHSRIEITSFAAALLLILSGGIIGYLITGINVTIPAHYHGVIIGITVGLMGFCYSIMPQMGFAQIKTKAAVMQILIYTAGQVIHILGLAISGGYGALRKSPDGVLTSKARAYMGMMHLGGAIALVGGMMFVILIFISLSSKRKIGDDIHEQSK